ncbi:putative Sialidase domain-containing protein [Gammaproteobacteria bacterium]
MTNKRYRPLLSLETPLLVDERSRHLWFPTLHLLGEEILCLAAVSADEPQGVWPVSAYLSRDAGRVWRQVPEIARYALSSVQIGPRETLLLPYELAPLASGNHRAAIATGTRVSLESSGVITAVSQEVRFDGFPREVASHPHGGLRMATGSNVVELADGALFTTLYGCFEGERRYSLLGMTSRDSGNSWSFRACLADGKNFPWVLEGPSEATTIILPDSKLVCIYRIDSGEGQDYHHSDSVDNGHHWTRPRPLSGMGSVKPQGIRFADGTLLLTGGRPGLSLWASRHGRAWQTFDLAAHHNATIGDHARCFDTDCTSLAITTSYTALCRLGPQTALVCYDRLGNGWDGAPGPLGARDAIYCLRLSTI